ncbi:MAG: hypothetical protein K2Y37_13840 [Pirellulales bacterium]|nr:hypothetical protein [Pirellulales bacterium]
MRLSSAVTAVRRDSDRAMPLAGMAALVCYATHAAFHLVHGRWYDLVWACHLAAILVGVGLIARNSAINGIGVLLGLMGLPLWLADLATGGQFYPSSLLTHVVALALGLYGVARLGLPSGTWWKTIATLIALIAICRLTTPAEANINVAFNIQRGWVDYFTSHVSYLAVTIGAASVYFFVVERVVRRLLRLRSEAHAL